ncbi:amidohydrolase family protein [Erwinia tasmaniensis]|uniref:amidohydrolase family protein n=1 Tax=Erwinia tasmaniensis TaxID=338565 RepID=UPI003A4E5163
MNTTEITVNHLIALDGSDLGPSIINIGPSGKIHNILPANPCEKTKTTEVTAIPLLADSHAHLAISDGVIDAQEFHTLERVDAQLRHLATRGVGHVHSLGTDQRWLQERLRNRIVSGEAADKAFGYSAGIGFGAVQGWPPEMTSPEPRFRPIEPEQAIRQVKEMADLGCRTLKVWVDDFGGRFPKIPIEVMRAVIKEAHQHGIVTFAHVHFHVDAEALVSLGVNVLAHSVRDKLMSPQLIANMAEMGTSLVPTLSREEAEYAFSLDDNPYMRNEFFLASGKDIAVRLRDKKFSHTPDRSKKSLEIACENVARVHAMNVPIGLGTDSGFRMKLQGFAQHRELQLMNLAGMSPRECLKAALQINKQLFATEMTEITCGKPASFFIVEGNPLEDIYLTQNIREVWICGKRLSGRDTLMPPAR